MPPETLLTPAGLKKLEAELEHLTTVERPQIVERIKSARELGDLKENAEYHDAKDRQGLLESKILQLETKIRSAKIVENADTSAAGIGTAVTVTWQDSGDVETWHLTGTAEADPLEFRISHDSPIGQALMGAKTGDMVTVQMPRGEEQLRVDAIAASD